jgi:signal transduction histidine kinase
MSATTTDSQHLEHEDQAFTRLGRGLIWFWTLIVYGIVASSLVELAGWSSPWVTGWRLGVTLGLAGAFLAGFHLLLRWDEPTLCQAIGYLTTQLVLVVALTALTDSFAGLGFVLVANAVGALPRRLWAPALAVLLTVLALSWGVLGSALRGDWAPVGRFVLFAVIFTGLFVGFDLLAEHRWRMRVLARELASTRKELAAAERAGAVLAERQRMGREIHDSLAQGFTSIVLHLEAAEQALPPAATVSRRHLDQARQTARSSLEEARRLVWALRPEPLERASLPEALERLRAQWAEATGTPAVVHITGVPRPLAPEVEATLLRVAQEALANVARHAAATTAMVTLSYLADAIHLDIADDGCGFDLATRPAPGSSGGHGLGTMDERVQLLGGSLVIESAPDEGTIVTASVPA